MFTTIQVALDIDRMNRVTDRVVCVCLQRVTDSPGGGARPCVSNRVQVTV